MKKKANSAKNKGFVVYFMLLVMLLANISVNSISLQSIKGALASEAEDQNTQGVEPVASPWCSGLYGIMEKELGQSPVGNSVPDVDNNDVVDSSDWTSLATWYQNNDDASCQSQFVLDGQNQFSCQNYLAVDWCNGLKQGIADSLGSSTNSSKYWAPYDLNNDGFIDASDLSYVAMYIGQDDQQACFSRFPLSQSCEEVITPAPAAPWCSALYGILEKEMNQTAGNSVPDIDDNDSADASDWSALSTWYANGDDANCHNQFENDGYQFNCDNYLQIDWCNGLKQGIADSLGADTNSSKYWSTYDLNNDGFIDASDLAYVASYLGQGQDAQQACFDRFPFQLACRDNSQPLPVEKIESENLPSNSSNSGSSVVEPEIKPVVPQVLGIKWNDENASCANRGNATDWTDKDIIGQTEFADGTLVRACSPDVYVLENGRARHIESLKELIKSFFGKRIFNIQDWVLDIYKS